ncbi:DUF7948 domain-containing protein [Hymenobacter rubidus]|uniref:DUF7948 domain-containing protein n=1 Tax=Hymenobacter rubidus TaxID=1441626 RepID=UPI00191F4C3F|nr:gliding motility-associated C-terminal domain-containing protein [Hymenobacter rubidus]
MRSTSTLLCLLLGLFSRPGWAQESARAIEFIENHGQWDAHARYAAQVAPGARLFVEKTGLTYALSTGLPAHGAAPASAMPNGQVKAHGLRITFEQPNALVRLGAETEVVGQRHYLRGAPATWAAGVRAWRQLHYQQLWAGIDLVLKESPAQQFEYDLLLAAGANPAQARLRYQGADGLTLDPATGNLLVKTSIGTFTEYQPRAWQTNPANGQTRPVACAFELRNDVVSFRLGTYDHRRPLVIDPAVQFATYTGSTVENWGFAATHDAAGNLYTAGVVFNQGYPTTTGAYQTSFNGSIDIAIMKFLTANTGAGARAWATYLGGNNLEFPHSLLVNGRGELLLLGTTSSTDYPTTTTALSHTFRGGPAVAPLGVNYPLTNGSDLVLTRLSTSGGGLRASTYLGGTGNDGLLDANAPAPRLRHNYGDAFRGDLALDPQGNVYVTSTTGSTDFPGVAAGAYHGGLTDGLVMSLDSSFSQVRWATLLGGSSADAAYSLQREDTGGLLVAGGTTSPNLAGATGGYRATLAGDVDGFVARVTAAGALTQATYLGTGAYDQAFFVRSAPGGLLVLGQTLGAAWPGVDTTRFYHRRGQQFIQQLAPDLRTAGYAAVFGSGRATADISPTAFGVDCYGRIALAGWGGGQDPNQGSTLNLPTTANALQPGTDGQDFYLMQLSDGARVLDYATFFGSSADDHVDGGMSRFDSQLVLYQAVCACDQSGGRSIPIPAGAYTYAAHNAAPPINTVPGCNNAAFKFSFQVSSSPTAVTDTLSVCARAQPIRLGGSPAGGTWTGLGVTGSVATGFSFVPDTAQLGLHILTYVSPPAANGCAGTSTRRITVLPQGTARLTATQRIFCIQVGVPQAKIPLTGLPAGGRFSGQGVAPGTSVFDPVLAGPGSHYVLYEVAGGRCPAVASLLMTVKNIPKPEAGPPRQVCANDPDMALGGTPAGGIWTGPGVSGGIGTFVFTPSVALIGGPHLLIYSFQGDADCPPVSDTLRVTVLPAGGTATVPPDTAFCLSNQVFRLRGGQPAGGTWSGPGVTGTMATGFIFTSTPLLTGTQNLTYTAPSLNSPQCPGRASRRVDVNTGGYAQLTVADTVMCAVAGPQRLEAAPSGGIWTGPGVTGSVAAGFVFTPSAALAGVQVLSYTGPTPTNATQCPTAGTLRLRVLPMPNVLLQPITPINFCLASPPHGVVLLAVPAGGVFSGPGVVGNRFNPADVGPGRYTVSYTWNFPNINCPVVSSQTVVVSLVPTGHLPADTVLCGSQAPFMLRATPTGGTWSGPNVTAAGTFTPPAAPGTTELHYELPGACATLTYHVTVPAQGSITAHWTVPGCPDNTYAPRRLRFEATGSAAAHVQWDFGDGSAPATGAVVEHAYLAAGRYQPLAAVLNAPNGSCSNQFTLLPVQVQATRLPNIFTPNGDGQNDTFAPELGGCPGRLQVFSRWGQKVFDTPEYHNDWNGAGLPAGLYYFLLGRAEGDTRVKGWVEIVR